AARADRLGSRAHAGRRDPRHGRGDAGRRRYERRRRAGRAGPLVTMPAVPTVAAVIALPLAATLIEPLRRLALRYGMTDRPTGRKAHARPTPYLGGVAVAAATLLPILLLVERWSPLLTAIVVGGLAMGVLGLVDDLRPLRKTPRLLVEGGVAVAVAMSGVR